MPRSYSAGKSPDLTTEITGTGTANTLAKFTGAQVIGNSSISDDGAKVSTAEPVLALNLAGQRTITATAAGTTTLTVASAHNQIFTGVTTQTVVLPVVTTLLQAGLGFLIVNDSSGAVTVNSSGSNLVQTVAAGARAVIFCNKITADTTAAAWEVVYQLPATTAGVVNATTATTLATARAIGGVSFDGSAAINPGVPVTNKSAAYTLALVDANTTIYHPASDANTRAWVIPANGSIAFAIGTAITLVNDSANNVTVTITTDVLNYANVGAITTLTIPQYNQATIYKVLAAQWNANGSTGCTTA